MANIRITELFIENIGPFEYNHFHFPEKKIADKAEIHLITGENGTGKSTFLLMLSSILENKPINKRFNFKNDTSNFKICFSNNQEYSHSLDNQRTIAKSPSFLTLYQNKIHKSNYDEIFDFAFFAYSGYRKLSSYALDGIQEIKPFPLENALDFGNSINPKLLLQWVANVKTKEALALAKKDIIKAEKYKKSITHIESSISKIIENKVEFILDDDPLKVVIKLNNKLLEFDQLPDGLAAIVSWLSDLLMRLDRIKWKDDISLFERNFILLLDEIDIHLHPAWQRKILPVIQELFSNAQIFITTHSPFAVGSIDGAWIHKLDFSPDKKSQNATPVLSEDSKSYTLILNEFFGIHSYFGLESENHLETFRKLRNKMMRDAKPSMQDRQRLGELIKHIQEQKSTELNNLIGMELLQLKRILKIDNLLDDQI